MGKGLRAGAVLRANSLKHLAELIAAALSGAWESTYRPTIANDEAMADAFDHAMRCAGSLLRCWRGTEARR